MEGRVMITVQDIERLSGLRSEKHLISSLYLNLHPDPRFHEAMAKDLIRERREELERKQIPREQRERVEEDLERLLKFVTGLPEISRRALAAFSGRAAGVWETFLLAGTVRDILVLGHTPYIRPLTHVLDRYRRVCTLLVDRTRARIFEVFMGEIEEESEIFDEVPAQVREAGWYGLSEKRIDRHIDYHLQGHLQRVAEMTYAHFRSRKFNWLLLGGQPELLSEMKAALHSSLQQKLKRIFRLALEAPPKEVLEKTLELEQEVKGEEDRLLVSRLREALNPGGLGVSGVHETLSSIYEGAVYTLLVEEGFSQEGTRCPKCGFLGLRPGPCPICRQEMAAVPDIVDEAVASALGKNMEVVCLRGESGIKELGGMGAFLRYKSI